MQDKSPDRDYQVSYQGLGLYFETRMDFRRRLERNALKKIKAEKNKKEKRLGKGRLRKRGRERNNASFAWLFSPFSLLFSPSKLCTCISRDTCAPSPFSPDSFYTYSQRHTYVSSSQQP